MADPDMHVKRFAAPVRRRLADGREILYFDDNPGCAHGTEDRRSLDAVTTDSELRWDPIFGDWTVLAAHRQARTFHPPVGSCPLCPSREGRETEIPESGFDVVVFENRFPSLAGHNSTPYPPELTGTTVAGHGRCEVVVPTDDHDLSTGELSPRRLRTLVDAWAQRSAELGDRPDIASVAVFENRGEAVGVTLEHTHQQIYAFPHLPPMTAKIQAAMAS